MVAVRGVAERVAAALGSGPKTTRAIALETGLTPAAVAASMAHLVARGRVVRGWGLWFRASSPEVQDPPTPLDIKAENCAALLAEPIGHRLPPRREPTPAEACRALRREWRQLRRAAS